jgi:hypothetical protein
MGVTEVAGRLAVHPNTQGRVEWRLEEPSGPGRPRTVYSSPWRCWSGNSPPYARVYPARSVERVPSQCRS